MKISYCGKTDVVGGRMYYLCSDICQIWPERLKDVQTAYFGTKREVLYFMRKYQVPGNLIKEFRRKSNIIRELSFKTIGL